MLTDPRSFVNGADTLTLEIWKWAPRLMPGLTVDQRAAFFDRLGWTAQSPPSLQELGARLGISAEMARRAERDLWSRLIEPPSQIVELAERCLALLRVPPRRWEQLREDLMAHGLVDKSLAAIGLVKLVDVSAGRQRLDYVGGYIIQRGDSAPPVQAVLKWARGRTRSCGVCSVGWLLGRAGQPNWTGSDLAADLKSAGFRSVASGWVMDPTCPPGRDRLANLVRRMLAACGPLSIDEIVGGLERQVRFGRLPELPATDVLSAYLREHSRFEIREGTVYSRVDLDPSTELGRTEKILRDSFWQAPTAILSRRELSDAAKQAGIDAPTFNTILAYSPIVARHGRGRWRLRGGAALNESAQHDRVHARPVRFTWSASGELLITATLRSGEATVVSVPDPAQPFLEGREFAVYSRDGKSLGTVRIRRGLAWGFADFVARDRRMSTDRIAFAFNLSAKTCRMSLETD